MLFFEKFYINKSWSKSIVSFMNRQVRLKRIGSVLLLGIGLIVSLLVGITSAQTPAEGYISGTVTFDGTGMPASEVSVQVYRSDGSLDDSWYSYTNEQGDYAINLPVGTYKIKFYGHPILAEWYEDKETQLASDPITVTINQTTTVNANVAAAGWIAGTITDEQGNSLSHDHPGVHVYDTAGNLVASGTSSLNYAVGGLRTGYYKVRFVIPIFYKTEFYDDKSTFKRATLISVTVGTTKSNISAVMAPNNIVYPSTGALAGTLTRDGGLPFSPSCIDIDFFDAQTSDLVLSDCFSGNYLDTDYVIHNVPSGTYKIRFKGSEFPLKWYNEQDTWSMANIITITEGLTTPNINVDMTSATGCITGVVSSANDGSTLGDVQIEIFDIENNRVRSIGTDSNGRYSTCGLRGDYQLRFREPSYAFQWFDGKLSQTVADWVNVTDGMTETVNMVMGLEGCISGKVVDTNGILQPHGFVHVNDDIGSLPSWWGGPVDNNGEYTVCQLSTATYGVKCNDNNGQRIGYVWADVTAGQTTSDVTCTLTLNQIPVRGGSVLPVPESAPVSQMVITADSNVFSDTVAIVYSPQPIVSDGDLENVGVFYNLDATYMANQQPAQPRPGQAYSITVSYEQEDVPAGVNEAELALYYWNGDIWVKEPTSLVDVVANTVSAMPNHFSSWAILGEKDKGIYLPVILKGE